MYQTSDSFVGKANQVYQQEDKLWSRSPQIFDSLYRGMDAFEDYICQ